MVAGDCVSSTFLNSIAGIQNTELISSPNPYSRLDSFTQKQVLENEFCKDFACCGLRLENLHQLLEHYEDYHLSRHGSMSGNNDDVEDKDQIPLNSGYRQVTVDESLLPINLTRFFNQRNVIKPPSKEHLTNEDLNMLENAQKYASKTKVQTLDSIIDGLHTPSLSPSESLGTLREHYFEDDSHSQGTWTHQSKTDLSTSNSIATNDDIQDKPYRCHVKDCDKAYKNANGLKYHRLHGHCPPTEGNEIVDASKRYICPLGNCRKRYKNLNGLKYHMEHTHMAGVANLTSDILLNNEVPIKLEQDVEESPRGRKRSLSSISSSK